jgi:deoxyadenosine/deoxycytidine kinase
MKKHFVTIAGNIGIGKSTLTTRLAEQFGWTPYYEVVDTNPYLTDFYQDMKRWSFHLQIFFLSKRFQHHRELLQSAKSVVQDRSIYEDVEIFAKGLWLQGKFDERDYKNYIDLFECMCSYLEPPTLMVGLHASVKTLRNRITKRGRDCEKDISEDYLKQLNQHYDAWYKNYNRSPFLYIDTENLDLVTSEDDFQSIANLITTKLENLDQKPSISVIDQSQKLQSQWVR